MKRALITVALFLTAFILLSSSFVCAQVMPSKSSGTAKTKDIILTTSDIKDSYKVIGIISARGGEVNLENLNAKLKEEARGLGADYVIGINYFTYSGYVYAFGTAVKIKE